MITQFKIFEYNNNSENLIDYVDLSLIEKIFNEKYQTDFEEALYINPSLIWDYIDNDKFVKDFEQGYIDSQEFDDLDEYDLKKHLDNNLTSKKEKKIRELYLNNNEGENDLLDEDDYDGMIKELDEDEIREVILEDEYAYDVVKSIYTDTYNGYTAKEIIDEFYGVDTEFYNKKGKYSYGSNNNYDNDFNVLKKIVINYLDKKGILKQFADDESDDYKKEFAADYIYDSPKMQKNIIANNKNKVLELFDFLEIEDNGKNIGNKYIFQKAFIDVYTEKNPDEIDDYLIIPTALKKINDVFGLNNKISREYIDHIFLVNADNFNV